MPTTKSMPDRLAIAVLDKKGEIFTVLCNLAAPLFKSESPVEDINVYVEFKESPIETLSDLLFKKGLGNKKIGIESRHLVAHYHKELTHRLPHVQFVSWDNNFDEIRRFKSPFEIEVMKNAAQVTEAVVYDTWKSVGYGISEKDMILELEFGLRKRGADRIRSVFCSSGIRTTIPHATASTSPIEKGDLIKVDFHGLFNGYVSDVARVAFMAEVSAEREDECLRFIAAHKKIIDFMKPGVTASQVFYKGKEIYQELGFPFEIPFLGHSLGIASHERPVLQPFDDTELQPGMLISAEPRAKIRDKYRYHLEDPVLITENGPEALSNVKSMEDVFVIL